MKIVRFIWPSQPRTVLLFNIIRMSGPANYTLYDAPVIRSKESAAPLLPKWMEFKTTAELEHSIGRAVVRVCRQFKDIYRTFGNFIGIWENETWLFCSETTSSMKSFVKLRQTFHLIGSNTNRNSFQIHLVFIRIPDNVGGISVLHGHIQSHL